MVTSGIYAGRAHHDNAYVIFIRLHIISYIRALIDFVCVNHLSTYLIISGSNIFGCAKIESQIGELPQRISESQLFFNMQPDCTALLAFVAEKTDEIRDILIKQPPGILLMIMEIENNLDRLLAGFPEWDRSAPSFGSWYDKAIGWKRDESGTVYSARKFQMSSDINTDNLWKMVNHKHLKNEKVALEALFARGFLVAGGAVCALLRGDTHIKDLDIYCPKMSPELAENNLNKVLDEITLQLGCTWKLFRTTNCITAFSSVGLEIQLITRHVRSAREVVYGFDMSPCAVAWDGKTVTATPAARVAHAIGVFRPDFTKQRHSFTNRVIKYINKGFMAVLPEYDISCLPTFGEITVHRGQLHEIYGPPFTMIIRESYEGHMYFGDLCYVPIKSDPSYGSVNYKSDEEITMHNIRQWLTGGTFIIWEKKNNKWAPAGNSIAEFTHLIEKMVFKGGHPEDEIRKRSVSGLCSRLRYLLHETDEYFDKLTKNGSPHVEFAVKSWIKSGAEIVWARHQACEAAGLPWKTLEVNADYGMDPSIICTSAQEWYGEHYAPATVCLDAIRKLYESQYCSHAPAMFHDAEWVGVPSPINTVTIGIGAKWEAKVTETGCVVLTRRGDGGGPPSIQTNYDGNTTNIVVKDIGEDFSE